MPSYSIQALRLLQQLARRKRTKGLRSNRFPVRDGKGNVIDSMSEAEYHSMVSGEPYNLPDEFTMQKRDLLDRRRARRALSPEDLYEMLAEQSDMNMMGGPRGTGDPPIEMDPRNYLPRSHPLYRRHGT